MYSLVMTFCHNLWTDQSIILFTGGTRYSMVFLFRIPVSTLAYIIPETCQAIFEVLQDKHLEVRDLQTAVFRLSIINACWITILKTSSVKIVKEKNLVFASFSTPHSHRHTLANSYSYECLSVNLSVCVSVSLRHTRMHARAHTHAHMLFFQSLQHCLDILSSTCWRLLFHKTDLLSNSIQI